ncbi:hypothetical protein KCV87_25850 [Actinosynnema pretiosum subsp. pretiosum]|uniref:Secreted protein n=2 Tax=Actinosynnema TaxID=40566 RepID=C6WG55_ACTMD|nr:hypothetical protein [Actinosynnema mirum]ACU39819.1 hypothetical protein Amir_6012 [Actinosynnema mirum DSM 43827]AXX33333.1 Alpha-Lytic Protease [Actinosynnema pretiosum subsp. pretiosum]QUF02845.1 hypothetical protein KCV87_25850 [Actinosynnema pretiosum subsp. pretiosum]
MEPLRGPRLRSPARLALLTVVALLLTASPAAAATTLQIGTVVRLASNEQCVNGFTVEDHLLLPPDCVPRAAGVSPLGVAVLGAGGETIARITGVSRAFVLATQVPGATVTRVPVVRHTGTRITGATAAGIGKRVCVLSQVNGTVCGPVVALNRTVNWAEGTVTGLSELRVCASGPWNWAPVVDGSLAVGHVLGGAGCSLYFLPIAPLLAGSGLRLVV